jgi:cGMP-dependent protein kinase
MALLKIFPPAIRSCADAGKEAARVARGGCFGERALLNRDTRAFNVMSLGSGRLLQMHHCAFEELLGSLAALRSLWRFEAIRKVRAW